MDLMKTWYKKASGVNAAKFEAMVRPLLPKGVMARFEDYGNEIELADLEVEEQLRGRGLGTRALEIIQGLASKLGVGIILIPAGARLGDEKEERLRRFYEDRGFQGDDVLRYP